MWRDVLDLVDNSTMNLHNESDWATAVNWSLQLFPRRLHIGLVVSCDRASTLAVAGSIDAPQTIRWFSLEYFLDHGLTVLARFAVDEDIFLFIDCLPSDVGELSKVFAVLRSAPFSSLLRFNPELSTNRHIWFGTEIGSDQCHVFDHSGEEVNVDRASLGWTNGSIVVKPVADDSISPKAIVSCASQTFGVPPNSAVLRAQPFTRTVEVVSLETAAKLGGFDYRRRFLDHPDYDIYKREYEDQPKPFELAWCKHVDLMPHPAWKICVDNRYLVEELGYSTKGTLSGMECWPEFGGYWHIRRQSPLIHIKQSGGPFFLLGGDNAYYHWLLNWVPRLMAVDLFADLLPPLRDLTVIVPHLHMLQVPAFLNVLTEAGLPRQNLLFLHHNAVWHFDELIVPTFFFNGKLCASVADWYRTRVKKQSLTNLQRRVLISRRDAHPGGPPRRRVVNEDELAAALAPLGFQQFELSSLSMREQISLFQNAEFIVGPHGAGFANIVFSNPGVKAIVLENEFNHTFMMEMINVNGGVAKVIVCEDVIDVAFEGGATLGGEMNTEIRRNRDMRVDVSKVIQMILNDFD